MTDQELELVRTFFNEYPLDLSKVNISDDGVIKVDIDNIWLPDNIRQLCGTNVCIIFYLSTTGNINTSNENRLKMTESGKWAKIGHARQRPANTPKHTFDLQKYPNDPIHDHKNPSNGDRFVINSGAQLCTYRIKTLDTAAGIHFIGKSTTNPADVNCYRYSFRGEFLQPDLAENFVDYRDYQFTNFKKQKVWGERFNLQTHYRFSTCLTYQVLYTVRGARPISLTCQNSPIISWEKSLRNPNGKWIRI